MSTPTDGGNSASSAIAQRAGHRVPTTQPVTGQIWKYKGLAPLYRVLGVGNTQRAGPEDCGLRVYYIAIGSGACFDREIHEFLGKFRLCSRVSDPRTG